MRQISLNRKAFPKTFNLSFIQTLVLRSFFPANLTSLKLEFLFGSKQVIKIMLENLNIQLKLSLKILSKHYIIIF